MLGARIRRALLRTAVPSARKTSYATQATGLLRSRIIESLAPY
jgi:hypothetical protein